MKNVTLLEEPQAAFYAWLGTHSADGSRRSSSRACAASSSTSAAARSDFSLIRAGEEKGELAFVRDAVGDHLLLGGDNMDLALAKAVEAKLPGGKLDAAQFGALVQACRAAKEALLGPNAAADVPGHGRWAAAGRSSAARCR